MDDIMFSVAWECGDKGCPVQWHKANYWINSDGTYTVDNYSDGDHDPVEESELPTLDEVNRSWREYARHVYKTGEDPLGDYFVKRSVKTKESWQFKFNVSILGPVLVAARFGRRRILPTELPDHVKRYLNLDKGARKLGDFTGWAELEAAVPGVKPMHWQSFEIEHDKPRRPKTVARELKGAARRTMRGLTFAGTKFHSPS